MDFNGLKKSTVSPVSKKSSMVAKHNHISKLTVGLGSNELLQIHINNNLRDKTITTLERKMLKPELKVP
jgi:hypothetical protein